MQCPKCGFNNPASAKFCERCANIFYSAPPQSYQDSSNSGAEPKIQVMPERLPSQRPGGYTSSQSGNVVGYPLKKISDLFRSSISFTWVKKWRFIFLGIIPRLLSVLPLLIIFTAYAILALLFRGENVGRPMLVNVVNIILGILGLVSLIGFVIYGFFWSHVSYLYYLQTGEQSKKTILKQSFKKSRSFFWVFFLKSLIVFGGLLLFVIPGIIWGVKYGLAPLAVILEDYKGRGALKRSAELSRSYRWAIFKRSILFSYIQIIIQIIFVAIFLLVNLFGSLGPVFTILSFVLYIPLVLINILIGLLIEPLGYVYDFDIYNNLIDNKKGNALNKESYNFGQKLWSVVLMFLLPIIALGVGLLGSVFSPEGLFVNNLNKVLPEKYKIETKQIETNGNIIDVLENARARERDAERILNIKQIQTVLEFYFNDNVSYPQTDGKIILGSELYSCLDKKRGFIPISECAGENFFMKPIPKNPKPGGSDYVYQSIDGKTYRIDFELEGGTNEFKPGKHFATPAGIDKEPEIKTPESIPLQPTKIDSDSDGLTDEDEISIWHTDPFNPDSDNDGYKDGDEVEHGYDPLISGSARLGEVAKTSYSDFIITSNIGNCEYQDIPESGKEMKNGYEVMFYSGIYFCPEMITVGIFSADNEPELNNIVGKEALVNAKAYKPNVYYQSDYGAAVYEWGSGNNLIQISIFEEYPQFIDLVDRYLEKYPPRSVPFTFRDTQKME